MLLWEISIPLRVKLESSLLVVNLKMITTICSMRLEGLSLTDITSQSNHVLLNMTTRYNGGLLAVQIKSYFEQNDDAVEVLIFKGKGSLSIKRSFVFQNDFVRKFRKAFGK